MNRETEQHFTELPEIHIPRSKFVKEHDLLTTFSAGSIIPIYTDPDILPGTTVNLRMASVVRMSTPLFPTMGNAMIDIMWFFIPHRLVWAHWKAFWGENNNAWIPQVTYQVPQITTTNGFLPKTIADYMGIPTGVGGLSINGLPFRAYVKVWNDWFRSTPLQQESIFVDDDNTYVYDNNPVAMRGGAPLKANKIHDFFTSALPSPSYGPDVMLPLGQWAPVYTRDEKVDYLPGARNNEIGFTSILGTTPFAAGSKHLLAGTAEGTTGNTGNLRTGAKYAAQTDITDSLVRVYPNNLWADLTNATAASIRQLREAVAVQHFYEAQARGGGGRYVTFLKNIFGVTSPDASLQRSEYLGGKRIPIQINQVVQTSSTDATSPQGNTGAFSHTADSDEYFTKSFTEHGTLLGVAIVRYEHSYQQGIPEAFLRKNWYDFYVPQLANISEMPITNDMIYAQGTSQDKQVFGYQEAWGSYRYFPNQITGEFRSNYAQSLDAWHYGDDYNSLPILGSTWIQEDKTNIDRTLAVSSGNSDQFLANFYFRPTYVMPMPIYSVPGLSTF